MPTPTTESLKSPNEIPRIPVTETVLASTCLVFNSISLMPGGWPFWVSATLFIFNVIFLFFCIDGWKRRLITRAEWREAKRREWIMGPALAELEPAPDWPEIERAIGALSEAGIEPTMARAKDWLRAEAEHKRLAEMAPLEHLKETREKILRNFEFPNPFKQRHSSGKMWMSEEDQRLLALNHISNCAALYGKPCSSATRCGQHRTALRQIRDETPEHELPDWYRRGDYH